MADKKYGLTPRQLEVIMGAPAMKALTRPYELTWTDDFSLGAIFISLKHPDAGGRIKVTYQKLVDSSDPTDTVYEAARALKLSLDKKRNVVTVTTQAIQKEEEPTPVKKKPIRPGPPAAKKEPKPVSCPTHKVPLKYVPERGVWKCFETDENGPCRLIHRPSVETGTGQMILGKGKLDIRIAIPEAGGAPVFFLVADNGVALDVTDLIDVSAVFTANHILMRAVTTVQNGARNARVTETVRLTLDVSAGALIIGNGD